MPVAAGRAPPCPSSPRQAGRSLGGRRPLSPGIRYRMIDAMTLTVVGDDDRAEDVREQGVGQGSTPDGRGRVDPDRQGAQPPTQNQPYCGPAATGAEPVFVADVDAQPSG